MATDIKKPSITNLTKEMSTQNHVTIEMDHEPEPLKPILRSPSASRSIDHKKKPKFIISDSIDNDENVPNENQPMFIGILGVFTIPLS